MSKTIRKSRLIDYWKIGEHESWFGDMAAKGLHLKKIGKLSAVFEKGEPREIKYRIDIIRDGVTEEQKSLYKEYGWEYVTAYGRFSVFSSPESLHAAELHTDPEEQSHTLRFLDKELKNNVFLIAMLIILLFALGGSTLFIKGTFFLNLIQGPFLQQCILILVELHVLYTTIISSRSISSVRKSLSEGKPINHHANWRKSLWKSNLIGTIFIIIALFSISFPLMSLIKNETYTLPEGPTNLPVVRLAALENSLEYARKKVDISDGIDYGNSCRYSWSALAPVQYETDEQGEIKSKMWQDNSGVYSPSIHTKYYRLAFAGMSDGVVRDLLKRHLYGEGQIVQVIDHTKFDHLYIVNNREMKQIFASIGKQVVYVRYHGYRDTNQLVELLAESLSEGK